MTPASASKGLALVTGGGGAIAFEICVRLSAAGYRLLLVDIDAERMGANAKRLMTDHGAMVEQREADLSNTESVHALAQEIREGLPALALLLNNAGYIHPGNLGDLDAATIDRHISINMTSALQLCSAAAAAMTARGYGNMISIVSMGGILPLPGSAPYSAAKAGLRAGLTALNAELQGTGVRTMGVFPSGVDTPMLQFEAQNNGSALNFVGKVFSPADIADACMKALETGRLENYVPYTDSLSTRLVATWPWLIPALLPFFNAQGEKGREAFLKAKNLPRLSR